MGSPSDSSPNFDFLKSTGDADASDEKKIVNEQKSPKPSEPAEPESLDEFTFSEEAVAPVVEPTTPEVPKPEPIIPDPAVPETSFPELSIPEPSEPAETPEVDPVSAIQNTFNNAESESESTDDFLEGGDTQQFTLPDFEEPVDATEEGIVFDEVPAPENNVSDGSTLIIKDNPINQPETFVPPEESFDVPELNPPEVPSIGSEAPQVDTPDAFPSFDEATKSEVEPPASEIPESAAPASDEPPSTDDAPKFEMPKFDEPVDAVAPVIQEIADLPSATADFVTPAETPSPKESSPEPVPVVLEPKPAKVSAVAQPPSDDQTSAPAAPDKEATGANDSDGSTAAKATAVAAAAPGGMLMIGLISYASLVTLLLLWSMMSGGGGGGSQDLESLPDIAPEKEGNLSYVAPHTPLPAGHTIKVGDQQRFGNLNVEVIGITKEPLEFTHYSGDASIKRDATTPVWKLWLKLTNVSKDQEFAALDRRLLLRWVQKKGEDVEYANYYIAPQNAAKGAARFSMYRLPIASDWDLKEQHLGESLAPGASMTTYIAASDEQTEAPSGKLVWRFQIRKGLSPSGNGVTTMVEVPFAANDVTEKT